MPEPVKAVRDIVIKKKPRHDERGAVHQKGSTGEKA
jgi:hypothetical protein